jgi:hypothetical protein
LAIGNTSPPQNIFGQAQEDGEQSASVMIWTNLKPVVLQGNVMYAVNMATGKPPTVIVQQPFKEVAEATADEEGEAEGEPRLLRCGNYVLICNV